MHLCWTEAAAADLERIADYLLCHAPDRASRWIDEARLCAHDGLEAPGSDSACGLFPASLPEKGMV